MTLPDVLLLIAALACFAAWAHSVRTRRRRARRLSPITIVITADVSQAVDALTALSRDLAAVRSKTLDEAEAVIARALTDAPAELRGAWAMIESCLEGPRP